MILAIDFDGVLHDYKNPIEGRRMGPPIKGATDSMDSLKEDGHKLIIHSVGSGNPKHIEEWLDYYDIPYDEVTNIKPNADLYIDDKALHFVNWKDTLLAIGVNDD